MSDRTESYDWRGVMLKAVGGRVLMALWAIHAPWRKS